MSEMVRCDECHAEATKGTAAGWVKADQFGIDMRTHGSPVYPMHFCSYRCIADYFGQLHERLSGERR